MPHHAAGARKQRATAAAHRITPPDEPSRDMASASAVDTKSSACCRVMPSLHAVEWRGHSRARQLHHTPQPSISCKRSKTDTSWVPPVTAAAAAHLCSESRKPHRKVLPEPSVAHGSRTIVPPMGQPYTCRRRARAHL